MLEFKKCVTVDSLVTSLEAIVVEHINNRFDTDIDLAYYDKNMINNLVSSLKKKERKAFIHRSAGMFSMVTVLNVKINRNLYNFLAFMNDLSEGTKSLKDEIWSEDD